jgi:hypothetical protein
MTPLTEKQLEVAAREYCRLNGLDPDSPDHINWKASRITPPGILLEEALWFALNCGGRDD